MWCKRIIPCLDVKNGRVVKGINFLNLRDAGDPVTLAQAYYEQGADELVFLDVSASVEGKETAVEMARQVAREVFIPFTIGGGIRSVRDIEALLKAGADKVSLGTAAVENPKFIEEAANEFGSQAIVISLDAKRAGAGWVVKTRSATATSNLDAIEWARKVVSLGAGEILLNSIDRDGTKKGFDIELTSAVTEAVNVPVIASGGAGRMEDFVEVFKKTNATAALAASLFHYGEIKIPELKRYLMKEGVGVRPYTVSNKYNSCCKG
jgi:cyclase